MAAIRIESVTRRFGNVTVLDEVSMDVSDREVVSIVGPSGSGKSTLLRIVAGLDSRGRQIRGIPIGARAEHGDGVSILCPLSAHDLL